MISLGVTAGNPADAACALVTPRKVLAAIESSKLPGTSAALECLRIAGIEPGAVEVVAVARPADPRTLEVLRERFPRARLTLVDHHRSHAASALCCSPFEDATVLTIDGGQELVSARLWQAKGGALTSTREMLLPDSVAGLYSRVTALLGFHRRADEHKVQWMSAAGDDRFVPLFRSLLGEPWGGMNLHLDASDTSSYAFGNGFYETLGVSPRAEIPPALRPHVASGLQRAIEGYAIDMAGSGKNLCLAGGLFFNALLVRAFERSGRWENVFVQPAAGNAGTAIGAAASALGCPRLPMHTLALGPAYSPEEIKQVLENCKLRFRYLLTNGEVISNAIDVLRENKILAWMQGRMEFGPRALGNRSILASPLDPYSSENLNVYIKHREGFRKFAAAVPSERCGEYFETSSNARFLATVSKVLPEHRETFRAALMGGDLIRVHSVDAEENPLFHRLLTDFGKATGLPVLYNTSFNLFGDPLVCTPRDAVRSFYSSGIDAMIAGNFLIDK